MKSEIYVPDSLQTAGDQVRLALSRSLEQLAKQDFLRAWCSVYYLFPGLHPKALFEANNEWPGTVKRFAAEAWRRFEAGELTDNELYCYQPAITRIARECARLERVKPWLFRDHFGA
jgi:hypothetical protein